jgi:hypothetical protein
MRRPARRQAIQASSRATRRKRAGDVAGLAGGAPLVEELARVGDVLALVLGDVGEERAQRRAVAEVLGEDVELAQRLGLGAPDEGCERDEAVAREEVLAACVGALEGPGGGARGERAGGLGEAERVAGLVEAVAVEQAAEARVAGEVGRAPHVQRAAGLGGGKAQEFAGDFGVVAPGDGGGEAKGQRVVFGGGDHRADSAARVGAAVAVMAGARARATAAWPAAERW